MYEELKNMHVKKWMIHAHLGKKESGNVDQEAENHAAFMTLEWKCMTRGIKQLLTLQTMQK